MSNQTLYAYNPHGSFAPNIPILPKYLLFSLIISTSVFSGISYLFLIVSFLRFFQSVLGTPLNEQCACFPVQYVTSIITGKVFSPLLVIWYHHQYCYSSSICNHPQPMIDWLLSPPKYLCIGLFSKIALIFCNYPGIPTH